jgi:hypothetical protein
LLVDGASPEAPLEGDEEDDEAAPESELEDEAVPPEAGLEGGEEAPELGLEGITEQGPGTTVGASARRDGGSPAGDGEIATCSCANGKQCSSK